MSLYFFIQSQDSQELIFITFGLYEPVWGI